MKEIDPNSSIRALAIPNSSKTIVAISKDNDGPNILKIIKGNIDIKAYENLGVSKVAPDDEAYARYTITETDKQGSKVTLEIYSNFVDQITLSTRINTKNKGELYNSKIDITTIGNNKTMIKINDGEKIVNHISADECRQIINGFVNTENALKVSPAVYNSYVDINDVVSHAISYCFDPKYSMQWKPGCEKINDLEMSVADETETSRMQQMDLNALNEKYEDTMKQPENNEVKSLRKQFGNAKTRS